MAKILVVDDERFVRFRLSQVIKNAGMDVEEAESGAQALSILAARPRAFDLVLLDWVMPVMTGIDCLRQLKADPILASIPVVMQTGRDTAEDIAEGFRAGALNYLTKPVDLDVLFAVIDTALRARRDWQVDAQADAERLLGGLMQLQSATFAFRTPGQAHQIRDAVSSVYPDPEMIGVPIGELLMNAVEHGNLGISYAEKSHHMLNKTLWIEIHHRLEAPEYRDRVATAALLRLPDRLRLTITDQGAGFNHDKYMAFNPERAFDLHGRGIAFANMAFDSLEYQNGGQQVITEVILPTAP